MTSDEHRAQCIEAMADAALQDMYPGAEWNRPVRRAVWIKALTAAFDALPMAGVRVNPIEATEEMKNAATGKRRHESVWRLMSAAGDITHPSEKKP